MKRIAIVGFGGAGYNAAKEIRAHDQQAVIDVYSDTDIGPYNPMLTTYFVKGDIAYEALFPFGTLETVQKDLDLHVHMNRPVTGLEPEQKVLRFADGSEAQYDKILISTGASAVMPPIPGIDLPGVIKMRTAYDALDLKKTLDQGSVNSALVIGASWVGIKVVEDLVARGVPCTLVDGADWMFYVAAFEQTACRVQRDLEAKGVQVSCGQMLSYIEQAPNGQLAAVMKNGRRFTADLVAVCIGVRMNVGFLKDSGLKIARGILVDKTMQTNYPDIYAAGDCCEAVDIQSGAHRNIGVWFNANQQGKVVGANMAGVHMEFDANVLVNLAHYLNYDFVSIGDISACCPEDEVYEYEDGTYYIRGVRSGRNIKCVNIIGSAAFNGVIKNAFIKSIESPEAELSVQTICLMRHYGMPESFINFMGGKSLD